MNVKPSCQSGVLVFHEVCFTREPVTPIKCSLCGHEGMPIIKKTLSSGGWVFFIVLLLFCLPLCWLPFVLDECKDKIQKCAGCGSKLG